MITEWVSHMKLLPFSILPALLLLAACSSEPSQADLQAAVQKAVDRQNESMQSMVGGVLDMPKFALNGVEKLSCTSSRDKPGYVCDIRLDITRPLVGRTVDQATARFIKTDQGWEQMEP
ncbi:hypothetical protein GCM10009108_18910 [Castellaniella ginsengisoli]|uniref:Lipoprotein n=2 Tax=Castellaniella ginsengisoli TaxID=546114 RepID=A0ABN1KZQ0_9BURK